MSDKMAYFEKLSNSEIQRKLTQMENEYNVKQIKINREIDELRTMNETYILAREILKNRGVVWEMV